MVLIIPNENHHTRLFTAYRAAQIYSSMKKISDDCKVVDLNVNKNIVDLTNQTIIIPIEWISTLINKNFQQFINQLSLSNETILTGRFSNFYCKYAKMKYPNSKIDDNSKYYDKLHMLNDPYFLINSDVYAYTPVESSWGCFNNCRFCCNRIVDNKKNYTEAWIPYSYLEVVDYIENAQRSYNVFSFCFIDNNFIGTIKHASNIANEIIKRGLKLRYSIETRVDNLNDEILKLLKKSGVRKISLGLESGSDAFLLRYNKGTTVDQNVHALNLLQRYRINVEPQIIMFYPDASYAEIGETLDFIGKQKLYNCMPNSGIPITKMMIFESDNPEDIFAYSYADEKVKKLEEKLKEQKITKIKSEDDFKLVMQKYLDL